VTRKQNSKQESANAAKSTPPAAHAWRCSGAEQRCLLDAQQRTVRAHRVPALQG